MEKYILVSLISALQRARIIPHQNEARAQVAAEVFLREIRTILDTEIGRHEVTHPNIRGLTYCRDQLFNFEKRKN